MDKEAVQFAEPSLAIGNRKRPTLDIADAMSQMGSATEEGSPRLLLHDGASQAASHHGGSADQHPFGVLDGASKGLGEEPSSSRRGEPPLPVEGPGRLDDQVDESGVSGRELFQINQLVHTFRQRFVAVSTRNKDLTYDLLRTQMQLDKSRENLHLEQASISRAYQCTSNLHAMLRRLADR